MADAHLTCDLDRKERPLCRCGNGILWAQDPQATGLLQVMGLARFLHLRSQVGGALCNLPNQELSLNTIPSTKETSFPPVLFIMANLWVDFANDI